MWPCYEGAGQDPSADTWISARQASQEMTPPTISHYRPMIQGTFGPTRLVLAMQWCGVIRPQIDRLHLATDRHNTSMAGDWKRFTISTNARFCGAIVIFPYRTILPRRIQFFRQLGVCIIRFQSSHPAFIGLALPFRHTSGKDKVRGPRSSKSKVGCVRIRLVSHPRTCICEAGALVT